MRAVASKRTLRSERGSASILMTGIMGVVVALSSAALLIAGYAVGYHRARAAADLSALSGQRHSSRAATRVSRFGKPLGRTVREWSIAMWWAMPSTSW